MEGRSAVKVTDQEKCSINSYIAITSSYFKTGREYNSLIIAVTLHTILRKQ